MKHLALLCAVALLAGCTAPFGGGVFTAKEAQGQADPRARQWRADAALTGLVGPEGGPGSPFLANATQGDDWAGREPRPDGNVGDGRLPQWYLQYSSPSGGVDLALWVYGDGGIETRERPRENDAALGDWTLDSTQAAEAAMQDGNFSRSARAADGSAAYILFAGEGGRPVWILTAGSESAQTGGIVFLDARTGGRMPLPDFGGFFTGGFPFGGSGASSNETGCRPTSTSFQGTVTIQEPEAAHPFEVGAGCSILEMTISYQGTLPTDAVRVVLEDAAGQALPGQDGPQGPGYAASLQVPGPGTYTARVTLTSDAPAALSADYDLTLATFG